MNHSDAPVVHEEETITRTVIELLTELTRDWDMAFTSEIEPGTRLVADLACESIDLVQFVLAIEQSFARTDFPFEQLFMAGGRYVDDLSVSEVVEFLRKHT